MKIRSSSLAAAVATFMLALASAKADSIPPGPYQESCRDITFEWQELKANCFKKNGELVKSTMVYAQYCTGAISNIDGNLACIAPWGALGICERESMVIKDGKLSAQCNYRGRWVNSTVKFTGQVTTCEGRLVDGVNC